MHRTFFISCLQFHINAKDPRILLENLSEFAFPVCPVRRTISVNVAVCSDLVSSGRPLFHCASYAVFEEEGGIRYDYLRGGTDRYVCARHRGDEISVCVLPDAARKPLRIWQYLAIEDLLLKEDVLILHSAGILYQKKAILFSAPSGTGKSTQAELWKRHRPDVRGLNGDRNLLYEREGIWYTGGLPWHGNAADCRNTETPLGAIAIVHRSPSDAAKLLPPAKQYTALYSQITVHTWDPAACAQVWSLIGKLIRAVPVIRLDCTMQPSAVDALESYLFPLRGSEPYHGTF